MWVGGSLANLTVTQPLLRGASRRIYLEQLTQRRDLFWPTPEVLNSSDRIFSTCSFRLQPSRGVGSGRGISTISPPSTGVSGFLGLVQEFNESEIRKLM